MFGITGFVGVATASVIIRSALSRPFVTEWSEAATGIDASDEELGREGGVAMYDVEVLHDHEWIGLHPLCHIDGDNAVTDIVAVGLRYDGGLGVHDGHALDNLKVFLRLVHWREHELYVLLLCQLVLVLIVLIFCHDKI